ACLPLNRVSIVVGRIREKQRKESSRLQIVNRKLSAMNKLLMEENDRLQKQVSRLVLDNGYMKNRLHTTTDTSCESVVTSGQHNQQPSSSASSTKGCEQPSRPGPDSVGIVAVSHNCSVVAARACGLVAEIHKDRASWFRDCRHVDVLHVIPTGNGGTIELIYIQGFGFVTMPCVKEAYRYIKYLNRFVMQDQVITAEKVHNFVFIMSEEMKRLIAYVKDLYEDTNSCNMVKVQWFDKVDEVGVPLPMDFDDTEIFSLDRQDLNVECIDGLAAVLSVQHYEKFKGDTRYNLWQPYFCCRQIDNGDIKPFDVTQLQGYWSQEVLMTMFNATSSLKVRFKVPKSRPSSDGGLKRKRDAFNDDANPQKFIPSGASTSRFYGENIQQLCPGCHVEVLSQDSGIRGCWFRCLILKRHKDKIKVRYLELQDADETGNLEEWVMLTRVAKPDQLGVCFLGRPMVRPQRVEQSKASCFDVGAIVDAWWHGGWWEGIVLCQVGSGRLQVYFPGENRTAEFGEDELRCSLEWVGNKWNPLKGRKDVTSKLTSTADCGSECLIGKQDPLNFYVPKNSKPQLERHQYDKG
ncbi:hypothetical protein ACJX0J_040371, partial [Zea mays]